MTTITWAIIGLLIWWFGRAHRRQRRSYELELKHLHSHDSLSDLPNRARFTELLDQALERAEHSHSTVAVVFIDLDNFKLINNSLGHSAGDQLLAIIAGRLVTCLRRNDHAARLGGDEFALLLENIADVRDVTGIAERIVEQLQAPVMLNGHEVFPTTSMGIALSPVKRSAAELLIRDAHSAMYLAKSSGKGRFCFFDPTVTSVALERLTLETDLRRAVERGEFRVDYQPIVALDTGEMVEVEALIRWNHPRRGLLNPADFIRVAEESGLILPIGQYVLREACRQARQWQLEFPERPSIKVCVNLSARQFQHGTLVRDVASVLDETGLPPSYLKLEITESVLMNDVESTLVTLQHLKSLGIQLAVDDFGTGYSSLNYLTRFPVDVLKIDRSFVDRLGEEREATAIVATIISLAKSLDLEVVGEGLESAHQSHHLRSLGCSRGQGYFFARPQTGESVRAQLVQEDLLTQQVGRL